MAAAEDTCARQGSSSIKLADIASELGIEAPAIYRHYQGLKGVIAALGGVALRAEIETFFGIEQLPFASALKLQAERCFDLYIERPGIARFLMADMAEPGGLHGFEGNNNLDLIEELFRLEDDLLQRGLQSGAIRLMSVTTFVAARLGPVFTAIALKDLQTPGSAVEVDVLKREYLEMVMEMLRSPS